MIKKDVLETLSPREAENLAIAYAMIISAGQKIPGMENEAARAEKNFISLMERLPERAKTKSCIQMDKPFKYAVSCKRIGRSLVWDETGHIMLFGAKISYIDAYTSPWNAKDSGNGEKVSVMNEQYKLFYDKDKPGLSAEEKLEAEKAANEKPFLRELEKRALALAKFQCQMAAGKKMHPLKRFKMNGKPFYEMAETFANLIGSLDMGDSIQVNKVRELLKISSGKAWALCSAIEKLFSGDCKWTCFWIEWNNRKLVPHFSLVSFKSRDDAKFASKRYSFLSLRNDGSSRSLLQTFSNNHFDIKFNEETSKIYKKINNLSSFPSKDPFFRIIFFHELIKQIADSGKVLYFREFCETMGLLRPESVASN